MCFIAYEKDCHVFVIMKNLIFFIQVSALNGDRVSFFVSYVKPHNCVSPKSLSRWIVTLLSSAGVDTSAFKAHSTRSVAGVLLQKSYLTWIFVNLRTGQRKVEYLRLFTFVICETLWGIFCGYFCGYFSLVLEAINCIFQALLALLTLLAFLYFHFLEKVRLSSLIIVKLSLICVI